MFVLISWTLLITMHSAPTPKADDGVEAIVRQMQDRQSSLKTLTVSFVRTIQPTEHFITEYARDRNLPVKEVKDQFYSKSECRFIETREGRLFYEETRPSEGGKIHKMILASDGKDSWRLSNDFIEEEWGAWNVILNDNIEVHYQASVSGKRLLADSAAPSTTSITAELGVAKDRSQLQDEVIDGNPCAVLSWMSDGPLQLKKTVWLDKSHGLVLRKFQQEQLSQDQQSWRLGQVWFVKEIASTPIGGNALADALYWYPVKSEMVIYNAYEKNSFNETIVISAIHINRDVKLQEFSPAIEDGSNVQDKRTGKSWVYGNGPSPRLRKMVNRQVEEAKKLVEAASQQGSIQTAQPPQRFSNYLSIFGVLSGAIGLCLALALMLKSKKLKDK